jgi:4-hydroxybenzoate polyprenyltransferase
LKSQPFIKRENLKHPQFSTIFLLPTFSGVLYKNSNAVPLTKTGLIFLKVFAVQKRTERRQFRGTDKEN